MSEVTDPRAHSLDSSRPRFLLSLAALGLLAAAVQAAAPACTISVPAPGAAVAGAVDITWGATDAELDPISYQIQYSLNGGVSWLLCTADVSSPTPAILVSIPTPVVGRMFRWDSVFDSVGLAMAQAADIRIVINAVDGMGVCSVMGLSIDNRATCAITAPAMGASVAGDASITFDTMDSSASTVIADFEFSTDGGTTWNPATAAFGSPLPNPASPLITPMTGFMFFWDTSADGVGTMGPQMAAFRVRITDGLGVNICTVTNLTIDNRPSCVITAPAPGASDAGDVTLTFGATDPSNDVVQSTFEYSTNGGITWLPCTAAGSSPLMNPDPIRPTPFGGVSFVWDSAADGVGTSGAQVVDLRASVDDGAASTTCTVTGLMIDNQPSCTITTPSMGASLMGDVTVTFDGSDPSNDRVTSRIEYSTNGGITWFLATADGASPISNPDPMRPTPFAGLTFIWDARGDGVGIAGPVAVDLRITVDDGPGSNTCAVTGLMVANNPSCTITAPSMGAAVAGDVGITWSGTDPANDPLTSSHEYSTDGGVTWNPATAAGASPTANPDAARASPFAGVQFLWDSAADGVGLGGAVAAQVRVTIDAGGGAMSTCLVTGLSVDNLPTCSISAPAAGAAVAATVGINWSGNDPSSDPLTSTFEWSTDAGATWNPAMADVSSLVANPDVGRATPFAGQTFVWDSYGEGLGLASAVAVDLRVTVDDGVISSTCSVVGLSLDNRPSCAITAPSGGAAVDGDVTVSFDATHPALDTVTSTFEFSLDGGLTWMAATAAPASPTANPDAGRATPFAGLVFLWDSAADMIGLLGVEMADLRITLSTPGGASSTCQVTGLMVNNLSGCTIAAPAPGATVAGDVTVTWGAVDPSNDPLTSTLEWSSDGGATWSLSTAAAGSPTANPDPARATPFGGVMFDWDTSADGIGLSGAQAVDLRITVDDGTTTNLCTSTGLMMDNRPTCTITAPAAGATIAGDITVTFDGADPSDEAVTSVFEYSLDGGATWNLATPAGSSPTANPDTMRATPFFGQDFVWDSQADSVGSTGTEVADLRVTVTDTAAAASTCVVVGLQIDNRPTCTLVSPPNGSGDLSLSLSGLDPSDEPLTSTFEYSLDGGATWNLATAAAGSPTSNPDPARPTPFVAAIFLWDTQADSVGLAGTQAADLRVTVVDTQGASSACSASGVLIDNQPTCAITSPGSGATIAGDIDIILSGSDPSNDLLTSTFEYSLDGGATWLAATPAAGSMTANPDVSRPTPFILVSFEWDSSADAVGLGGPQASDFRVSVADGRGGLSTCTITGLQIDNRPTCNITAPAGGALVAGDVTISFGGVDPSNELLTSVFEYSLDAGATWNAATAAAGSPAANPDVARASPFVGVDFWWDTAADALGLTGSDVADLRITITDTAGASTSCSVAGLSVANGPTCVITTPSSGATVAGDVALTFDATDPANDAITSTFEFSLDGGATWLAATAAPASALANPDVGRTTPFAGVTFDWDSSVDGVGATGSQLADLRVTVDDGSGGVSTCSASGLSIDNRPACNITAPAAAGAVAGDVAIVFDGSDPSNQTITSTFEYSLDGGATWLPATAAAGSPLANPDPGRATPFAGATFVWGTALDGVGIGAADVADFRVSVVDTAGATSSCTVSGLSVDNATSCAITNPPPAAMIAGEVPLVFSGSDSALDPLTSTFEYSLDAGATWSLATAAPASALANPDAMRATPFAGVTFLWDSSADAVGLTGAQAVDLRITVDDGFVQSTCAVSISVDNRPVCMITAPMMGATVAGQVDVVFGATDPSNEAVTSIFEYSLDAGATWSACTASGLSPTANPDVMRPTPFAGRSFRWDSAADGVGLAGGQGVDLRIRVADPSGANNTCGASGLSLDNQPSCSITAPAGGAAIGGDVAITFDGSDPSGDLLTSLFEYSLDAGATWNPATAGPTSPLANPDVARPTPFVGAVFEWDSQADGVALLGMANVELRIRIDDGSITSQCAVSGLTADNMPTCTILSPGPGVMAAGDVAITYDVLDQSGDLVTTQFEYSLDGGATFATATAAPGSPTASPDPLRPTPILGRVFLWDSQADGVGLGGPQNIVFRLTVDDTWAASNCTVSMIVVDNVPTCAITAPAPGATVSGDATFSFMGSDPSGDPLTSMFEFSIDSGITWSPATAAAGSPTMNPDVARPSPFAGVTFEWDTHADSVGLTGVQAAFFRVAIDDGFSLSNCSLLVMVDNMPTCTIVSPGPGTMAAGDVSITFDASDPSLDPVTSTFEYSLDSGVSWNLATPAPASPTPNPDPLRPTPIVSRVFVWDTASDSVGTGAAQNVVFRVSVDDGFAASACSVTMLMVDNVPTCAISSPPGGGSVAGDVDIVFDGDDPSSDPLTSTLEFSTDAGTTWSLASAAPGSPVSNPDAGRATPFVGVTFTWDTVADGAGLAGGQAAFFRIAVDDGVAMSNCSVMLFVDNQPTCAITMPLPGAVATRDQDFVVDGMDPSSDPVDVTFEFSIDAGVSWQLATAAPGSPVPNPDPGRATPFVGATFTWDTVFDVPTPLTPQPSLFRVTVSDGVTASTCQVDLTVDNTLVCLGICGDCDQNMAGPNLLDALAGAQIAVGLIIPTMQQAICCDVNSSGEVNILDSLLIAQWDVGLMPLLICP